MCPLSCSCSRHISIRSDMTFGVWSWDVWHVKTAPSSLLDRHTGRGSVEYPMSQQLSCNDERTTTEVGSRWWVIVSRVGFTDVSSKHTPQFKNDNNDNNDEKMQTSRAVVESGLTLVLIKPLQNGHNKSLATAWSVSPVNSPSESSSSSSASFSRTSAGRVIPTAGVGSNIIVSKPLELLSAMVLQYERQRQSHRWAGDEAKGFFFLLSFFKGRELERQCEINKPSSEESDSGGRAGCWCCSRLAATSHRCVRNVPNRHDRTSCGASRHTWPCECVHVGVWGVVAVGEASRRGLRARCPSLAAAAWWVSWADCRLHLNCAGNSFNSSLALSLTHSLPTAQSPLHHSNSRAGRTRPRGLVPCARAPVAWRRPVPHTYKHVTLLPPAVTI